MSFGTHAFGAAPFGQGITGPIPVTKVTATGIASTLRFGAFATRRICVAKGVGTTLRIGTPTARKGYTARGIASTARYGTAKVRLRARGVAAPQMATFGAFNVALGVHAYGFANVSYMGRPGSRSWVLIPVPVFNWTNVPTNQKL